MLKTLQEVIMDEGDHDILPILNSVYVNKIYINKENNEWNVILNSKLHIPDEKIEIIRKKIVDKLDINGILNIIIDEKKEIVCDKSSLSDRNVYNSIIGEVFSTNPVIACLLQACEYEIVDNNLNIFASNEFTYSLLKSKNAEGILRRYFVHNLCLDYKISIQNSSVDLSNYELSKETEDKDLITQHLKETRLQNSNTVAKESRPKELKESNSSMIYGKRIQGEVINISSISEESGIVVISGEVFKIDTRETKSGKYIYTFAVTDYTSSIYVKLFLKPDAYEELSPKIATGAFLRVRGEVVNDKYNKELVVMAFGIEEYTPVKRMDMANEKRVELHLHTQMSSMDGVSTASALIKRAKEWGHKAIAITDHGVVQAFPEAMESGKKNNIKIIYGVEAYLVDDGEPIVIGDHNQSLDDEFVVFDIETTGLNKNLDEIIEIGAVKIKNGKVTDRFFSLIKPGRKIPDEIVKLTGINDDMVKDMPSIQNVMEDFMKFIGSSPVVAHNAKFDTGFIKVNAKRLNIEFKNSILDTLTLSRWLLTDLKKHKLNIITDYLGIKLDNHHRAVDDADATARIFVRFVEMLKKRGANDLKDIDKLYVGNFDIKKADTYHLIILVKNQEGLYNLYKLISMSHINHYHKRPRIPKSLLHQYRDGLIIGGACEAGQIFKGVLNGLSDDEFSNIISLYDYLEVQPIGNNRFLIDNGTVENEDKLREFNKKIINLGKRYNKPVVATCDVHFLDPNEEYYRRILMAGQGFSDADKQAPLYLRTTDEMLEEFMYLGSDKAFEIVVSNTNLIADQIETIKPIPDETFPPKIEGAEEEIRKMTLNRAHEIYGDELPEIVQKRLDKELNSIINNGYAVLYLIAHKLVAKSLQDGYLVGSRGSVGSSFVATMCRITEVNPLAPHYICPKCKNSEFFTDGSIGSGVDLPDKNCPCCGEIYLRDGFDIPFETFLGFEGDKEPDIDLNFSGEYQPIAHKYTEELFGEGHTFRAGTIGTIAEKTAYGYVKNYLDERKLNVSQAEVDRLVKGCTGVKRTSGQHPGGIMVVPRDNEIYEFTPVQRPADDPNSDIITTHFDYHSISGRLLKLDILGHDDPTVLRMLQNITGLDPTKIPVADPKVLKLFTSTESLDVTSDDINCEVGTLGIPEFGTKFVRQMLIETQPKTFTDLVRISGLSHGTDVWINNAQELIKNGTVTLKEVIPTRDDIMVYLMYKGLKPKSAFNIMEKVRKGKGLRDEDVAEMKEHDVPQWYIDSCNKIKYMFPKGHAVAYVMSALRIAYTKVYYPEAFYSTYFTVRADDFDADLIVKGPKTIEMKMKEIENQGNNASQKDKGLMTILEIALEMYKRGFKFRHVSLYESDATNFLITPGGILPPFRALQGVGDNAAKNIVAARKDGVFLSKEDLQTRSKASKTVIEILEKHGCLKDLPETNQLSLF